MHPILDGFNWRYKFGGARRVTPPPLPQPVATPRSVTIQAQQAGQAERKRIRGFKGKASTIFAGRRTLAPATVARAGLKTTFG